MGRSTLIRSAGLALSGVAALALTTEAWSQVTEIVVTTRKREENLQEIPIAVEAVTAAEIERKGIVDLGSVLAQSASVTLDQGFAPQDQRIVIRGLSPTRGRQNVAVLVDDIDITSETLGATAGGSLLINPRLFDLQGVEIVKGPQNALYGRSAFAGAVRFITRKPGDVFEARAATDIGSDGQLEFSGGLSGPITDSLKGSINGVVWTRDGFYTNSITGGDMGGGDGTGLSGTLVWAATDSLTFTTRVERSDDEFDVTPFANGFYPDGAGANGQGPQAAFLDANSLAQLNHLFTIPIEAQTDPDGAGPLARVTGTTAVLGIKGEVPDADQLRPRMSEDPRTCGEAYPANLQGCGDYPGTEREITRLSFTADWDFGVASLKSLSHYATADTTQDEGSEDQSARTGTATGELHVDNETDLYSQEFRVVSNGDNAFRWVGGVLFWKEDAKSLDGSATCLDYSGFPFLNGSCGAAWRNIVDTGALPQGAPIPLADPSRVPLNPARWTRDTDHFSIYAHIDWEFVESLTLSVEARQTWEDTRSSGPSFSTSLWDPSGTFPCAFGPPFIPCPSIGPGTIDSDGPGPGGFVTIVAGSNTADVDDDFFAPKATIAWQATDNQNYYFYWAEAYKPAGVQGFTGGAGTFDPVASKFKQEKLIVWELGAKTDWLDNTLRVNAAAFFQDFKNKQVSSQVEVNGILQPRTVNAGKAEVWGAELDLQWVPIENLSFGLSYTWLDTEYTEYTSVTRGIGQIAYVGNCREVVPTGASASQTACVVDYSGNELEGAAEHTLIGNARVQFPLFGDTDWFVDGDFEFQDDRFAKDNNQMVFPSYWLFNFRAGITNDTWSVLAYVDNAFDDDTVKTGFADGDIPAFQRTNVFMDKATVTLPDRRQYGIRVNYRFGGE
jgi:outer membrane receptor protein involved in Fe transport